MDIFTVRKGPTRIVKTKRKVRKVRKERKVNEKKTVRKGGTILNPKVPSGFSLVPGDEKVQIDDKIQSEVNDPEPHDSLSLTSFPGGSIHIISTRNKMIVDDFIRTPYLDQHNYTSAVVYDRLRLKLHDDLVLGHHATRTLITDNAGGASEYSEAMSMHYLENVYSGTDFILETEVKYWSEFKMVDFICTIYGQRIGVSVTRAMGFPCSSRFTEEDGRHLLSKKINDIIVACDLVITCHSFAKSILHVWCQNQRIADIMKKLYKEELEIDAMGHKVLCDVLVIITVCSNKNVYTNNIEKKNLILNINH